MEEKKVFVPTGNFPCFTARCGVGAGLKVCRRQIGSPAVEIPVVQVGEEGRGRHVGFVPVQLLPTVYAEWQTKKDGEFILYYASVGTTKAGNPKLFQAEKPDSNAAHAVVAWETGIGYRGCNAHTGDRMPEWSEENKVYAPWPCIDLCNGEVANGAAGRAGSGMEYISLLPSGIVARASKQGRLYGRPGTYYYVFQGDRLKAATWEDRTAGDLF